ncbi:MAG TPA: hypothetical protein VL524_13470 [Gemmatimonadaceae bacterium]|jgi:hypothetical protein|nr:hypothetical protein [Gemmatimonadaceae bacterium]
MTNIPEFVGDLRAALSSVDRALDRQLVEYGTFLPHVFMADVTRALCASGPSDTGKAVIGVIADHFEHGDAEVRTLVLASFLENLDDREPGSRAIVDALPPALAAARANMEASP